MSSNKRAFTGILAIFAVVVLAVIIYTASYARIESVGFCKVCHMIIYDTKEYQFNEKRMSSKPHGLLVGCPECHREPYREYKNSDHSKTDKDYRPGCPNCHDPHSLARAARYMFTTSPLLSATDQLIIGSREWEAKVRPALAMEVRQEFIKNDGKLCRECHKDMDWDLEPHQIAKKENMTCIECHFNLVHKQTPWPEKEKRKAELGIE